MHKVIKPAKKGLVYNIQYLEDLEILPAKFEKKTLC